MLNSDLATLYQTETKYINRAIKRNPERFPESFAIKLTDSEWINLKCQIGTSSFRHGGRRNQPLMFTEQGVAMLSAVIQTPIAILVSVQIIEAFVAMRKSMNHLQELLQRMDGQLNR